jgi:MFS family permease
MSVVLCSLVQQLVGKREISYTYTALFILSVFCSYFWGVLSDRKGRKPVLIISSICLLLSTLLFGFSVNYAMAVVTRFLVGCSNGKNVMS